MNKKCIFCKKDVPINRKKYCSVTCIKRSYYIRKNPNCKSYLTNNPDFYTTQTGIGFYWEKYVANKTGGTHIPFNKNGVDVVSSLGNLDVKVCELYRRKSKCGKPININSQYGWWVFNKNKPKINIDFYYCICLVEGKPIKELCIPTSEFKTGGITVGNKSKYDSYSIL